MRRSPSTIRAGSTSSAFAESSNDRLDSGGEAHPRLPPRVANNRGGIVMDTSASPAAAAANTIGRFRWRICALLFAATTINYLDRQVLGVLKPDLERILGWTELDYSHIVASFQIAYAIGLVSAGAVVDKLGTRIGYALSISVWSLAAMCH